MAEVHKKTRKSGENIAWPSEEKQSQRAGYSTVRSHSLLLSFPFPCPTSISSSHSLRAMTCMSNFTHLCTRSLWQRFSMIERYLRATVQLIFLCLKLCRSFPPARRSVLPPPSPPLHSRTLAAMEGPDWYVLRLPYFHVCLFPVVAGGEASWRFNTRCWLNKCPV